MKMIPKVVSEQLGLLSVLGESEVGKIVGHLANELRRQAGGACCVSLNKSRKEKSQPTEEDPLAIAAICPDRCAIDPCRTADNCETLRGLPITPVIIEDFCQVPDILYRVYCAGLKEELKRTAIRKAGITSGQAYWARVDDRLMTRGRS